MPVKVIVGAQWGDEGKGKIVDLLSETSQVVARFQGGANAGHTVVVGNQQFILHLIPSGILHPGVHCYIGNGVVIDPGELMHEIEFLESRDFQVRDRLFISGNAHIIFPYHKILDKKKENDPNRFIGTTGRGIGPAYVDKFDRIGIRVTDLLHPEHLREKVSLNLKLKAPYLEEESLEEEAIVKEYLDYGEKLGPNIGDISRRLNQDISDRKNILLEGAQGTLLDVDFGTYPYVTSSNPSVGSACTGLGISPKHIDTIMGLFKAYMTRVGEGPFPTEFERELGETVRRLGHEFGATTGRPRRCGWLDSVLGRYVARVNGLTEIAISKLDVLDKLETIKICTGYRIGKELVNDVPADIEKIHVCTPIYEELPGWQQKTSNIRKFERLPRNTQNYIRRIEELIGVEVSIISVGSERDQTIFCE